MVCSCCNINKDLKHFRRYKDKRGYSVQRRQCYSCLAVKQKAREGKIAQPRAPKEEPEVLEVPGVTKKCCHCKEVLAVAYFYKSSLGTPFKTCKNCHNFLSAAKVKQNKKENGGSERVPNKPNIFADETQMDQTHQFLKLLGWSYNGLIWFKKDVKDESGKWLLFEEQPKKKRYGNCTGGRKKLAIHEKKEQIIKEFEDGYNAFYLADIYSCSHTSIRKLIRDYYDEKRSS